MIVCGINAESVSARYKLLSMHQSSYPLFVKSRITYITQNTLMLTTEWNGARSPLFIEIIRQEKKSLR